MRRVFIAASLFITGCAAHYRVDLLNATPHPVEVRITEDRGSYQSDDQPRAVVAPGGRFDYRMLGGDRSSSRYAAARLLERPGTPEARIPLGDTAVIHARIRFEGDQLLIVPVAPDS